MRRPLGRLSRLVRGKLRQQRGHGGAAAGESGGAGPFGDLQNGETMEKVLVGYQVRTGRVGIVAVLMIGLVGF